MSRLLATVCLAALCLSATAARDLQATDIPTCTYQVDNGQFLDINPENTLCNVEPGIACEWYGAQTSEECQWHCSHRTDCMAFYFRGRANPDGSLPYPSCLLTGQSAASSRAFPGNIVGYKNAARGGVCGN